MTDKAMDTPEVVVFDLGKVLLEFDYSIAARHLAARGTVTPEMVHKFIGQSPLLFRYETGLMTKDEFYKAVCAETGFKGDLKEFSHIFGDIFAPMDPMIELHAKLKQRGVPTFIFSNTNELALEHIRQQYPFFHGFDGYILSYEHGAMKPHAKLYEVVERVTKRRKQQLLYIDDRPENIAAGAERGWQVILQEMPEKTLAEVKKTGLLG
jgi:HAD superfamily hydrolase (TIGR01509 family)